MSRIYVASSWRNTYQQKMVELLRAANHQVYDFKNPNPEDPDNNGFRWSAIDPNWQMWTPAQFREALRHPIAKKGYHFDKEAIDWCTMGVLILPSGMSAHLEAGWIGGSGKPVCVYMPELREPELMYRFFIERAEYTDNGVLMERYEAICLTEDDLLKFAAEG